MIKDTFDEISVKEKRLEELGKLNYLGSKEFEEISALDTWLKRQYSVLDDRRDAQMCAKYGSAL